ncbi:hypothetical protein J6590_107680, partial [Homalodisca vitripennis]
RGEKAYAVVFIQPPSDTGFANSQPIKNSERVSLRAIASSPELESDQIDLSTFYDDG